jgi:hypothetical protein
VICDIDCDGRLDLVIGNKTPDKIGGITLNLNASKTLGNFANIHLRMDGPNPYAVGTLVEVWKAGTLDTGNARPFVVEKAHPDATPIHVGLGQATRMDLRVTFPGKQFVVHRNVALEANMTIRPDGAVKRTFASPISIAPPVREVSRGYWSNRQ